MLGFLESPKQQKKSFTAIAGNYVLVSPYHKNKKLLPFNVESDGFVSTVEYKGYQAYLVQQFYNIDTVIGLIERGTIKEGKAAFPRSMRKEDNY